MADMIETQVADYDYEVVISVCDALLERIFKNYRRTKKLEKALDSSSRKPVSRYIH